MVQETGAGRGSFSRAASPPCSAFHWRREPADACHGHREGVPGIGVQDGHGAVQEAGGDMTGCEDSEAGGVGSWEKGSVIGCFIQSHTDPLLSPGPLSQTQALFTLPPWPD